MKWDQVCSKKFSNKIYNQNEIKKFVVVLRWLQQRVYVPFPLTNAIFSLPVAYSQVLSNFNTPYIQLNVVLVSLSSLQQHPPAPFKVVAACWKMAITRRYDQGLFCNLLLKIYCWSCLEGSCMQDWKYQSLFLMWAIINAHQPNETMAKLAMALSKSIYCMRTQQISCNICNFMCHREKLVSGNILHNFSG